MGLFLVVSGAVASEPSPSGNDPLVKKVYPDGTELIVKWSEVGKGYDNGASHGGPPKIVAYQPITEAGSEAPVPMESQQKVSGEVVASSPEQVPFAKEGFYLAPSIGGAVVQNEKGYGGDVSYAFNAGVRFDLGIGYRFNDWVSLEFAPGIIYNTIESITIQGTRYGVDGQLIQVPLMLNPILTIPTDSPWEPFVGAGVGGVYTSNTNNAFGDYSAGTTTAWNFCYSGLAGLNYHVDQNISVGFVYKFTGIDQGGTPYDDLLTHSVEANATFRF